LERTIEGIPDRAVIAEVNAAGESVFGALQDQRLCALNRSGTSSRKTSTAMRRTIIVTPSAINRSRSTERTSDLICSPWVRFVFVLIESCHCTLAAAMEYVDRRQDRSSGPGSRRVPLLINAKASNTSAKAP
jgi:hypothetical protein